jgi:hypothetical protein
MVGDDLLGTGSVVHVPLITRVGMPFELQACHIDMEGCEVYRHGMLVHMPPLFWTSSFCSHDTSHVCLTADN